MSIVWLIRFNDISSSMAASTDSFQNSAFSLKEQMQTVTKIVPKFETAANKIESSSKLYLQGAEKIEASHFSEHLESLTADLANTQKSFSQTTDLLGDRLYKISENHQQATELAQQIYTNLQTASNKLQDSAVGFIEAAETFKESDFANQLTTATNELITIPQQFNESTAVLHQSTDALGRAIDNINISTQATNNLIEQVNNLNQKSAELLETSDRHIQQEISSLNNIVTILNKHKEQINTSLSNFGEKILKKFEQQTDNNVIELQKLTTGINNNLDSLQQTQIETAKLITILNDYQNHFTSINSNLSNLASTSEQQGKQLNSNLNGVGIISDRLLTSFEQRSQNNIQNISKLIAELKQITERVNNVPSEIKKLISAIEKHEQQMNSNIDRLNKNISNKAHQQINNYNQQIQNITEKFNKIL